MAAGELSRVLSSVSLDSCQAGCSLVYSMAALIVLLRFREAVAPSYCEIVLCRGASGGVCSQPCSSWWAWPAFCKWDDEVFRKDDTKVPGADVEGCGVSAGRASCILACCKLSLDGGSEDWK